MAKQKALPGMENRKLADLNDAAEKYAEFRDARMALLRQEIDQKSLVLALMKKHRRTSYTYEDLEITLVPGEEKLRAKVHSKEVEEELE